MNVTGLAAELLPEITKIPVVDCHEHLPPEAERVSKPVDALTLFSHYCKADLESAGLLQGPPQEAIFNANEPLGPRWETFKPYFEAIRYGSYAYSALAYMRDILGFDDLNDDTVEAISARLQEDNQPGLYKKVIQDICGIETSIECIGRVVPDDQPFFVYLTRSCAVGFAGDGAIQQLENQTGRSIHTLADCVDALGARLADAKQQGAVGMKIGAAYQRKIEFPDVPACDAEPIFARLRGKVRARLSDCEIETLEDYLIRREVEACIENDLNVVIHTGYQAGNRNDIRNARSTHLWSLLKDYPKARFDLFHGSFPYIGDMTVLGKYFENVTLNMCWMHIMSPEVSRRALREWLDTVPVTKIFAFGGDYHVIEKVYGHLKLARADVAIVLAEKVEEGRMTTDQALEVARLLFNENPKRWYRL